MACLVCFGETETPIKCGNPFCSAIMCRECTEFLIDYSFREEMIPRCPSANCKNIILHKNIRHLSKMEIYPDICLKELIKTKGDIAQKRANADILIEKLRKERQTFIRDHFPAAIAKVADLAYKNRVTRLEKQKRDTVAETLSSSHKICMNLMCKGLLDDSFKCIKCTSQFCKDCEKPIIGEHKCDERDKESISFIRNMVKCPKCSVAIERSEGCSMMKCANCGTNFDYRTGKEGGNGNNHNVGITTQNRQMLSVVYGELLSPDLLNKLIAIEKLEPVSYNGDNIVNHLKKHYKGEAVNAKELVNSLHRWLEQSYRVKKYFNSIIEIENLIRTKELRQFHLDKFYQELS